MSLKLSIELPKGEQYPDYDLSMNPAPEETEQYVTDYKEEENDPLHYRYEPQNEEKFFEKGLHQSIDVPETSRPLTPYGNLKLSFDNWKMPTSAIINEIIPYIGGRNKFLDLVKNFPNTLMGGWDVEEIARRLLEYKNQNIPGEQAISLLKSYLSQVSSLKLSFDISVLPRELIKIFKRYESKHSTSSNYVAEYNIKLTQVNVPDSVRNRLSEDKLFSIYSAVANSYLLSFMDAIEAENDWIKNVYTEGRSGGWLEVELKAAEEISSLIHDKESLKLPANDLSYLKEIADGLQALEIKVVNAKKDFFKILSSEAFWAAHMNGNVEERNASLKLATPATPSEAQKDAGNYKMDHVRKDGLDISIENSKGSIRRGTDPDGKEWSQKMKNSYGYIKGTVGTDKDHLDCFLSNDYKEGMSVFVVNQLDNKGKFDEHKAMLGFENKDDAEKAYVSNYEKGWDQYKNLVEMSMEEFKKWMTNKAATKEMVKESSLKLASKEEDPEGFFDNPEDKPGGKWSVQIADSNGKLNDFYDFNTYEEAIGQVVHLKNKYRSKRRVRSSLKLQSFQAPPTGLKAGDRVTFVGDISQKSKEISRTLSPNFSGYLLQQDIAHMLQSKKGVVDSILGNNIAVLYGLLGKHVSVFGTINDFKPIKTASLGYPSEEHRDKDFSLATGRVEVPIDDLSREFENKLPIFDDDYEKFEIVKGVRPNYTEPFNERYLLYAVDKEGFSHVIDETYYGEDTKLEDLYNKYKMNKTAQHNEDIFVCFWLPKDAEDRFNHIRGLDDELHLTLAYVPGVKLTDDKKKDVLDKLSGVAENYPKIKCKFTGIGTMKNEDKTSVALVNVRNGAELHSKIIDVLRSVVGDWERKFDFIPHVSLKTKGDGKTKLKDLKSFSWTAHNIGVRIGNDKTYLIELGSGVIKESMSKVATSNALITLQRSPSYIVNDIYQGEMSFEGLNTPFRTEYQSSPLPVAIRYKIPNNYTVNAPKEVLENAIINNALESSFSFPFEGVSFPIDPITVTYNFIMKAARKQGMGTSFENALNTIEVVQGQPPAFVQETSYPLLDIYFMWEFDSRLIEVIKDSVKRVIKDKRSFIKNVGLINRDITKGALKYLNKIAPKTLSVELPIEINYNIKHSSITVPTVEQLLQIAQATGSRFEGIQKFPKQKTLYVFTDLQTFGTFSFYPEQVNVEFIGNFLQQKRKEFGSNQLKLHSFQIPNDSNGEYIRRWCKLKTWRQVFSVPETYVSNSDVDQQKFNPGIDQFHMEDHETIDNGRDWYFGETDYTTGFPDPSNDNVVQKIDQKYPEALLADSSLKLSSDDPAFDDYSTERGEKLLYYDNMGGTGNDATDMHQIYDTDLMYLPDTQRKEKETDTLDWTNRQNLQEGFGA